SKTLFQYAYIARLAIKYRSIPQNFRFEPLRAHHLPHLMDLGKGVCEDEPLSQALGKTFENSRNGLEYVYQYAIAANSVVDTSLICYENVRRGSEGGACGQTTSCA
ncbi:hypothetical protein PMAYCL1PPCAC_11091, partial [Pristionchus mayeri]